MPVPSTDSEPPAAPPAVFAQAWAVRFGFAVLVGFTLIVGLAFMDAGQRSQLEGSRETTAVGDLTFFVLPDPAKAPAAVATLEGAPLLLAGGKTIEIRDTHTRRIGRDAASGLSIYQPAESATESELTRAGGRETLLLKTATGRYLAVRPAAP